MITTMIGVEWCLTRYPTKIFVTDAICVWLAPYSIHDYLYLYSRTSVFVFVFKAIRIRIRIRIKIWKQIWFHWYSSVFDPITPLHGDIPSLAGTLFSGSYTLRLSATVTPKFFPLYHFFPIFSPLFFHLPQRFPLNTPPIPHYHYKISFSISTINFLSTNNYSWTHSTVFRVMNSDTLDLGGEKGTDT
jgi:hypothetical protein